MNDNTDNAEITAYGEKPLVIPDQYKEAGVPDKAFYEFCKNFKNTKELVETEEWKKIYSLYFEFDPYELDMDLNETKEDKENYSPEKQREEFIKCGLSFNYFCSKYVRIMHPIHGSLPFMLYKYQRRTISEYEDNRFTILSKFRQGGLTTVTVIWGLWRCMFQKEQQILVMSKTDREATEAGGIAKRAMEFMPSWLRPGLTEDSKHIKLFEDTDSRLMCFTPEAARGKSITLLIIDEAAFIPDMETHWKSMYPVIATGGSCCVVSTVNGLGNWYEETYHKAADGDGPFTIIELDYWEHPDYNNPDWVEDSRSNLGEKGWKQEILRSFLGSGDTYIRPHIIEALDRATRDNWPIRTQFAKWTNKNEKSDDEWDHGALWIWKEPIDGHEYILSADCAEGVGDTGDNSCIEIIDLNTLEQVAEFYSNTVPPHIFAQIINEIGFYYNTALVVVENMASGGAVLSNLQNDLAYDNIYYDVKGRQSKPGLVVQKANRPVLLESLQHRLTNRTVKINSKRIVRELKTFIYHPIRKKAEAIKGKHDDAIMAISMALYVRDAQMRGIPVGAEVPEEMVQIFKSDIYEEIKQEILEGAPEDWVTEETEDPILAPDPESFLPGISYVPKRRHDKLLKEFGW